MRDRVRRVRRSEWIEMTGWMISELRRETKDESTFRCQCFASAKMFATQGAHLSSATHGENDLGAVRKFPINTVSSLFLCSSVC